MVREGIDQLTGGRIDGLQRSGRGHQDAAIRAIFDAYGEKSSTFLTTVPTFGYYEPCAQQQGMVIDEVPYADDLQYPLAAISSA